MFCRTRTTFERFAEELPSDIKFRQQVGYGKITDYTVEPNRERSVPLYTCSVSQEELNQLVDIFGVQSTEDDEYVPNALYVHTYEELPHKQCEVPFAIAGFYGPQEDK